MYVENERMQHFQLRLDVGKFGYSNLRDCKMFKTILVSATMNKKCFTTMLYMKISLEN